MARSLRVSPASALLGAALLGLVLLVSAALQVTAPWTYHGKEVQLGPDPWAMVQVREGTPYVVPPGRVFVLTALGRGDAYLGPLNPGPTISFAADGKVQATLASGSTVGDPFWFLSVHPIPAGLSLKEGSTLSVDDGDAGVEQGRAWGYLAVVSSVPPADAIWVAYEPSPTSHVQIEAGTPFVVPTHKILVVTALGCGPNASFLQSVLTINGQSEVRQHDWRQLSTVPVGLTAPSGATVAVVDVGSFGPTGTTFGRAWGYLANR